MTHDGYPRALNEVQEDLRELRKGIKENPASRDSEALRRQQALEKELIDAREKEDPLGAVALRAARLHARHAVDSRGSVLTGSDVSEIRTKGTTKEDTHFDFE